MAPTRTKKRNSTESTTSQNMHDFPAPPRMVPTKAASPAKTPSTRSPIKKARRGITVAQKQALIDNLQLEVTERARKLRAQYNLQAQGMRTRIEIRVNRIPMALRKAKMGDLLAKHSGPAPKAVVAASSRAMPKSPVKALVQAAEARASPSPQRAQKRHSEQISTADKENEDFENPKKRSKPLPAQPTRTVSRKVPPSQVLSPRSANSRTIPRSPIRPGTAMGGAAKTYLARPVSPLKPAGPIPQGGAAGILTNMVEKAKTRGVAATRKATDASTAGGRGKKGLTTSTASAPNVGRASDSSEGSNGTVIRKAILPPKKETVKKTMMGTLRGMTTKKTTTAGPPVPPKSTAPTGRILRKRN